MYETEKVALVAIGNETTYIVLVNKAQMFAFIYIWEAQIVLERCTLLIKVVILPLRL